MRRKERYVDSFRIAKYLEENYDRDIKDMSGEEVIKFIFGDIYEYGDFKIIDVHYFNEEKWHHRLNRLWAYPLTWLCAPYQYVVNGEVGWDDKTKFGRWMLKIAGY